MNGFKEGSDSFLGEKKKSSGSKNIKMHIQHSNSLSARKQGAGFWQRNGYSAVALFSSSSSYFQS